MPSLQKPLAYEAVAADYCCPVCCKTGMTFEEAVMNHLCIQGKPWAYMYLLPELQKLCDDRMAAIEKRLEDVAWTAQILTSTKADNRKLSKREKKTFNIIREEPLRFRWLLFMTTTYCLPCAKHYLSLCLACSIEVADGPKSLFSLPCSTATFLLLILIRDFCNCCFWMWMLYRCVGAMDIW